MAPFLLLQINPPVDQELMTSRSFVNVNANAKRRQYMCTDSEADNVHG